MPPKPPSLAGSRPISRRPNIEAKPRPSLIPPVDIIYIRRIYLKNAIALRIIDREIKKG